MKIKEAKFGDGSDGAIIVLTPDEVATAIDEYLVARSLRVHGPRTVAYTEFGAEVLVDPSGYVINSGMRVGGVAAK